MILPRNKDELYDMLWADYQQYKRKENGKEYDRDSMKQCFMYSYYLDRKTRVASRIAESREAFGEYSRQSRDKFVLLCAARQLLEKGELDEKEYGEVFGKAAKGESKHFAELFEAQPSQAYDELTYKLLCGSIQDMFSKKGYKQPKYDEDGNEIGKAARPVPAQDSKEGYTDEIEMLYCYSQQLGSTDMSSGASFRITPEHIESCSRLYGFLQKVDSGDVFIPLYIDPSSGAGVYLIGDRHLTGKGSERCSVYTVWFDTCYNLEEDIKCADGEEFFYLTMEDLMIKYETVEEAFRDFRRISEDIREDDFYYGYSCYNNELPLRQLEKEVGEGFSRYVETRADIAFRKKMEQRQIAAMREETQKYRENLLKNT